MDAVQRGRQGGRGGHLLHGRHPRSRRATSTRSSTTSTWRRSSRRTGAHILGIKDMAGLLQALRRASSSIKALKEEIGIPIHLHTHDTSGQRPRHAAQGGRGRGGHRRRGAASMSGLTSQPSLGALVAALERTERETGLDLESLQQLDEYWEVVREYYAALRIGP